MLYLGIDQHAMQLTIDLGDESGDLVLHRKVSTQPTRLEAFLEGVQSQAGPEGFLAIVEVTGFHDYLLKLLAEYGCLRVLLVQPVESRKRKTDRRDARELRDLLWTNRHRLDGDQRLPGIRVVTPATPQEAEQRQLTSLMKLLRKQRSQILNRLHTILKKHNWQHAMPAKRLDAVRSQVWLANLPLEGVDQIERDALQDALRQIDRQIAKIDKELCQQLESSASARIVSSTPGLSVYSSLVVSSRLGDVRRFANGDAMANFVGLTPSCRNSDANVRHGKVTKLGSPFIRHVLCQGLVHVLRKDGWMRKWYRRIKARRGSNVARVAVMRRLVTILYAMLRDRMPYIPGGPERYQYLRTLRGEQQLSFDEVLALAYAPH